VEHEDGEYVVVSDKEIAAAYPKTTQTIEIETFVPADGIPFIYLERPYYVAPINRGAKVYALLREALVKTGKVGLAKVVVATKQHLASLVPSGPVLVLNLLRWGDEVKSLEGLDLPPAGIKGAKLSANELKMAEQLVKDMTDKWDPDDFKDEFKHEVMKLVARKVKAGKTETVIEPEEEAPSSGAEIIDLTELLQRSLKGGKEARSSSKPAAKSASKTPAKQASANAAGKKKTAAPVAKARKAA
jgi:DNA end-binding protein Ku